MKNTNVVGVDIGYGYTKVCADKLTKAFPSRVAKIRNQGLFGQCSNTVTVGGQEFAIGDDITDLGDHSVSAEFIGTPEYLALLGRALTMAKSPEILVMGLPPGIFNIERVKMLEKTISEAHILDGNGERVPIPEIVTFIPQGLGIYYDFTGSSQHFNMMAQSGNIVVIDIGTYTLDIVLVEKGGRYIPKAARSYPLGISTLFNLVKNRFNNLHNKYMDSDDNIMKLIQEGCYTHFGTTYRMDVAPLMDEYINEMVLKVISKYSTDLVDKSVAGIVVGGGGVNCIGQLLNGTMSVEDPQMSNARGYYQYGRMIKVDSVFIKDEKTESPKVQACAV